MEKIEIAIFYSFFISVIFVDRIFAALPVFSNLPATVSVGEGETTNRAIHTISVTDATGHSVSCSVSSTNPPGASFRTLVDTNKNKYGVYTDGATFDYATNTTFVVTVACTDGTNTASADLTVKVIDNDLLRITNLPATVSYVASTTGSGIQIIACTHSDALGHTTITYTMESYPTSSSFSITSAGVVTTAQALNVETNSQILLYITVTDSVISVTEILTVQLTILNNFPDFTNLPATTSVAENLAGGTVFYTLTAFDADAGATLTSSMNVPQPSTHAAYFTFNPASLQLSLTTGFTFDYESLNTFNITFTITDTIHSKTEILIVQITDVYEACYFDKTAYSLTTVEGTAGSNSLNPGFIVRDYDGTTTYTLSFHSGNNSDRFTIGSTTGLISFAVTYDIDSPTSMATYVILTVICTDATSQTGTTKVYITITDRNDNAPTFTQSSYVLTHDQYTTAGSLLGALNPTDADSGQNAVISCAGTASTSSTSSSTYYSIANCAAYLQSSPSGSLAYGTITTFTVTATDQGSPTLSSTTTVNIIYTETTTTTVTTTTTTAASNWFDDPTNVAIFCLALIFGLLLLALLLYFLIRCCWTGSCCGPHPFDFTNCCRNSRDCCRPVSRAHRRVVTPREPEKGGPPDDYWGRDREDSDYGSLRNQDTRKGGNTRYPVGRREYPDFPQSLTPTDVAPRVVTGSRPLPIGYY